MRTIAATPRRCVAAGVAALAAAASLLVPISAQAIVNETSAQRFGGPDRYETSVAVAEAFLDAVADNPGRSDVSAAIVVSGEDRHAAYATTAAALAAAHDAPILLTQSGELAAAVGEFIKQREFELVLIVGGPHVVSAEVERSLSALAGSVRRIGGSDVYAASVAVAAEVGPIPGSAGEWGSRGRTALMANGESVADALAAGPLAYRGSHPLLLTPAAQLDIEVSAYLDRSDVEHVLILGGTAAVSAAVESALAAKDITTSRIAGSDRFETATLLAKLLLGSGRPDACFDGSTVGLAAGDLAPDAVSSGPLLGELCAPVLLTQAEAVPVAVNEFLVSAGQLGGAARRLELVVFGGAAAIADSTVTVVRSRALRGAPFTAVVSASAGSATFTVTFNEDVKEDEAINPERYTVNNTALVAEGATTTVQSPRRYSGITLSGRTVTVELVEPLSVGNTITVVGETGTTEGRTEIAVDDTLPALESVFYRVPRPPAVTDTAGPAIQIVAVAGETQFVVLASELALRRGDRLRNDVTHRGEQVHELTVVDAVGEPKTVTFVPSGGMGGSCPFKPEDPSPLGELIGEQCYEDPATLGANLRYTARVSAPLEVGDVITVRKGALHDQRRNPNRLTRYTVTEHADNADNGDFFVKRVAVGNPRHGTQASLLIRNNTCGADGTADCEGTRRVRIDARSSGVAAGAAGNGWIVYPYVDPDRAEPADSDIDVGVDPVHRIISYTFENGKITLANLAAALNADTTFRRHFNARVVSSGTHRCRDAAAEEPVAVDPVDIADASGGELCGGFTTVGVRVTFTDNVSAVTGAAGFEPPSSLADLFLDGGHSDDVDVAVRCQRRGRVVYLEYTATGDALVPRAGTPVHVTAGIAANYAGTANLARRSFNLRFDASIPDQFGYEVEELDDDAAEQRCEGGGS